MKLVVGTALFGFLLASVGGQEAPPLPTNNDLPPLAPPPSAGTTPSTNSVPAPPPALPPLNPPPVDPQLQSGFPEGTDPEELMRRFAVDNGLDNTLPELQPPPETPGGILPPGLAASELEWHRSPYSAQRQAAKEKKYFMVFFGGWEWNPVSDELAWELFATKEFTAYADAHIALSFLDFPKHKHETHEKLLAFRDAYKVRGFPTIILFKPDGTPFFRETGYRKGKARTYLESIQAAVAAQRQTDYERREVLVRQGYRDWTGAEGNQIFARLRGRDAEQRLQLTTPTGYTYHIAEENFSEDDRLLLPYLEKKLNP